MNNFVQVVTCNGIIMFGDVACNYKLVLSFGAQTCNDSKIHTHSVEVLEALIRAMM